MGMTIEDCISKLTEILEEATEDENSVCYVTDVDEPTLKMAIDTMRKYQKILKIVSDFREYQKGISCGFGGATYMQMVSEVLEDGN